MAKTFISILSPDLLPVISLRQQHGWAGYGVYCALVHLLGEQPDGSAIADYSLLAFHLHAEPEMVRSVAEDFGLFQFEETPSGCCFFIDALRQEKRRRAKISERRAEAASRRWHPKEGRHPSPPVSLAVPDTPSPSNASRKEEKKGGYDMLRDPGRLSSDKEWVAKMAASFKCSEKIILKVLPYFLRHLEQNNLGVYDSESNAKVHFYNWMAKTGAKKHLSYLRQEEQNEQARRERDRRDEQAVSYAEYLRNASRNPDFASTPLGRKERAGH